MTWLKKQLTWTWLKTHLTRRNKNRFSVLSILLIALLLMAGCAKREAQKELEGAQQAKQEAQNAQAPVYTPDEFNDADRLLSLAQSQFDGGEYEQAISTAQQAAARFNDAINGVEPVRERVQQEWDEIDSLITEAEENIQTAREEGVASSEEINTVADRVNELRQQFVDEINREIDQEVLDSFKAEVNQALQETEALATAHLRPQATDARDQLQEQIDKAREFKAEQYATSQFNEVVSQFESIEQAYQEGEWQQVIDLAGELQPQLDSVIETAQKQAAGDILADLETQIEQARQTGITIEEYTNALDLAEQAVQSGMNALSQQDFTGAIAASEEAKTHLSVADNALQTEAENLISQAGEHLQQAQQLDGQQYASAEISRTNQLIEQVQTQIENGQFVSAYKTAQQAEQAGLQSIDAAKSGKARQELQRVEGPFSRLHSQGGGEYAEEAYEKAQDAVQDLRAKMSNKQYQAVEEGVDEALQVVQDALAELEKSTEEFIAQAEEAIEDAREANAPEWVSMQFANAQNMKSAAERELENDRFLASIRNSQQAIQSAEDAESRAYQLQAQNNIQESKELISKAEDANQKKLSPLAYRNATQALEKTQKLISAQQFKEAYEQSEIAVEKADRAYNNMVMTAQEKTDSALQAEAMTYSRPEIQQALVLLTEAEEAQKANNYTVANEKAQKAIDLAEEAEYFTWKQRSISLIHKLEGIKESLEEENAHLITPGLYNQALAAFAEAKTNQIDGDYAESFQQADKARRTRDQIWSKMESELNQFLNEMKNVTTWMGENALDEKGRELKVKLMDEITILERQIALDNWAEAYVAADKVNAAAQKYSSKMGDRNLNILAGKLSDTLSSYKKQNALEIVPEQKEMFNNTLKTLRSSAKDGETYSEAYQKYEAAQDTVDELPNMIVEQAGQRTEEIASILQQARNAGPQNAGAQKFFPERYEELASELQWLRNAIRGEDYAGISQRLSHLEEAAPKLLEETQVAVAEDDYLENLQLSLNQANNLLQDFGPTNLPKELFIASRLTEHQLDAKNVDMYRAMQTKLSAKSLRINAEIFENRIKEANPPETLNSLHDKAAKSFELLRKAAEGFEVYGNSDLHDIYYREKRLEQSYEYLEESMFINQDLQFAIDNHRELGNFDKLKWQVNRYQDNFEDFYMNFQAR